MKTTIKADFDRWLYDDVGWAEGLMKVVLVNLFAWGTFLFGVLFVFDLITGDWDEAGRVSLALAGLFGGMATYFWGYRAINRWRDRAIRRILARTAESPPPGDASCPS
jgi:hypothetical protein